MHTRRTRYLSHTDSAVISTIQHGVLFVMATWSGPSHSGFAVLNRVLSELDPEGRLELVVVDTDGCPGLHEVPEFTGKLHGWGEVAWVIDGRVLRTSGKGYHPECFEAHTRELLACTPKD